MGLLCDNQDDLTCINIDLADEIILCLQTELLQGDNVSSYWDAAVVGVPWKREILDLNEKRFRTQYLIPKGPMRLTKSCRLKLFGLSQFSLNVITVLLATLLTAGTFPTRT